MLMKKLALVILLGLGFIGCTEKAPVAESSSNGTENAEEAVVEAVPVTATELLEEYANNEVKADSEYKGKMLEVTGTISSINSGLTDNAVVHIGESITLTHVAATGDAEFDISAAKLNKGQEITVTCMGEGEVIGTPQLSKCVIK